MLLRLKKGRTIVAIVENNIKIFNMSAYLICFKGILKPFLVLVSVILVTKV